MRATSAQIDMAGNVWVANNWKPNFLDDVAFNPGGDGIVIFIGLASKKIITNNIYIIISFSKTII